MSQNDRFARLGTQIRSEIKDRAKQRAVQLFGEVPSGTQDVGEKESIDMMRRNWNDPSYREGLKTRVGAENFRDMVIEMFGGNEAVWPMPKKKGATNGG